MVAAEAGTTVDQVEAVAEAGTTGDRAEVRTADPAGTKAAFHLWLMGNGIPMGCRFAFRRPGFLPLSNKNPPN